MNARSVRVAVLAVLIPLLVLLGIVLIRRGTGPAGRSAPGADGARYANATVYPTWDKFASSKAWKRAERQAKPKVVFIGTDGATWNIINPLIEEGALPNFARLKREGAFGVLRSGECYVSPPAWVSMMTGFRPEHTGIYTFGIWNEPKREFVSYASGDVAAPFIWDIASLAGRRVAVTNMAATYPARQVNGIMVTGLLTPIMIDDSRPKFYLRFTPRTDTPEGAPAGEASAHADAPASYSPVLEADLSLFANELNIRLYDSADDGIVGYDCGVAVCTPGIARLEKGTETKQYRIPLDRYSPWMKLDFRKHRKQREGWFQLKVDTRNLPVCEVQVSAVYCSPDDPDVRSTYPVEFGTVIKDTFEYYFPYTPFDSAQVPEFTKDAVRYATFFYEYDDWDLFLYTFYETDKAQHFSGFSEDTRSVHATIDRFVGWVLDRLVDGDCLVIASETGPSIIPERSHFTTCGRCIIITSC
ncbi:MAG: alkaline phosphatase family protein [Chitinivibrionia bacterium]|nr:alkaline phosphatase family protein [Chitinivibrionia bacterium]